MNPLTAIFPMIPIIALSIPIVAILTKHQREMAALYQQNHLQGAWAEVEALKQRVEELSQRLAQQTMVLDDIQSSQRRLAANTPLSLPTPSDQP